MLLDCYICLFIVVKESLLYLTIGWYNLLPVKNQAGIHMLNYEPDPEIKMRTTEVVYGYIIPEGGGGGDEHGKHFYLKDNRLLFFTHCSASMRLPGSAVTIS